MKKVLKKSKMAIRGIREMAVAQTKDLQTVEGEWLFSGEIHLNYRYTRYQPMNHSYDKIMCFQNFPFDEML